MIIVIAGDEWNRDQDKPQGRNCLLMPVATHVTSTVEAKAPFETTTILKQALNSPVV
ncbi:MAG TPA: hypothetical protein VN253_02745 [Kofleriaceae bacterium]|nr:hypothetical protein [Kofleriaceae bacterium]